MIAVLVSHCKYYAALSYVPLVIRPKNEIVWFGLPDPTYKITLAHSVFRDRSAKEKKWIKTIPLISLFFVFFSSFKVLCAHYHIADHEKETIK